jgi:hypothetical protein
VKPYSTYTIAVLEGSNNIVFIVRCNAAPGIAILNIDGKGWPDTQILPDRSSACEENLDLETVW